LYIFYLISEQEIKFKINNYVFTFLLGGTLAFNELQIDRSEQKLLEELLYNPNLISRYLILLFNWSIIFIDWVCANSDNCKAIIPNGFKYLACLLSVFNNKPILYKFHYHVFQVLLFD